MAKYIDADKLKAEIDRIEEEARRVRVYGTNKEAIGADGKVKLCLKLKSLIDSLQQEQSSLPSNLDEAATQAANQMEIPTEHSQPESLTLVMRHIAFEMFKAGAEWMTKQMKQEQPEKSTKKNCNNCPHCIDRKDQYGWHFKGCFGGPYKGKFIAEIDECPLKQEQPEVDLEKEIDKAMKSDLCPEEISDYDFCRIARHFYELGKNSKWYGQDRKNTPRDWKAERV